MEAQKACYLLLATGTTCAWIAVHKYVRHAACTNGYLFHIAFCNRSDNVVCFVPSSFSTTYWWCDPVALFPKTFVHRMVTCVLSSYFDVLDTRRHAGNLLCPCRFFFLKRYKLCSDKAMTEILHWNAVCRVDRTITCYRTGYDRYDIRICYQSRWIGREKRNRQIYQKYVKYIAINRYGTVYLHLIRSFVGRDDAKH